VFAFPTLVFVVLLHRLEEPVRGRWERAAAGRDETAEDSPASFREAVRLLFGVRALRRAYLALPFVAGALIGSVGLLSIFYDEVFGVGTLGRGVIFAFDEPVGIVGLLILTPRLQRILSDDVVRAARLLALGVLVYGASIALIAMSPVLPMAVAIHWLRGGVAAILLPGVFTIMSLIVPPRARALGFTLGGVFVLFGLLVLPVAGGLADAGHVRWAIACLFPMLAVGAAILSSIAPMIPGDIERLRTASEA
jgi:branched-chain amino acid transport system ATP-binding protein